MNKIIISLLLLFVGFIFITCSDDDSNPINPNVQKDWEGNYPLVNTACNESILFSSDRFIGTSFAPSVYIMHKSGSGMHAISDQLFTFGGSWSPRRWKILFIADSGYGPPSRGLYVMNSDGTNRKRLTPAGEDVFGSAAWSPDGSKIAYIEIDTSDQYGRGRIKLINPDGTDPKILTNWYGELREVTWSPDSRRIIFDGFEYMSYNKLYIINSDGTGLSVLFEYHRACYLPSWSPDGTLVAFCSFTYIDGSYYTKIFTYDINTKKIKLLTSGKSMDFSSTWSSDSKTILYSSFPPGNYNCSSLYAIGVDGSNNIRLTDSLGLDNDVSWYK